jgi:hypothetical protein
MRIFVYIIVCIDACFRVCVCVCQCVWACACVSAFVCIWTWHTHHVHARMYRRTYIQFVCMCTLCTYTLHSPEIRPRSQLLSRTAPQQPDTMYDDVTLCMMMWHYVWWCDTMYDNVTLCMMMWHCVWWCDTVDDDVTLCMMMSHLSNQTPSSLIATAPFDTLSKLNFGILLMHKHEPRGWVLCGSIRVRWHLVRTFSPKTLPRSTKI